MPPHMAQAILSERESAFGLEATGSRRAGGTGGYSQRPSEPVVTHEDGWVGSKSTREPRSLFVRLPTCIDIRADSFFVSFARRFSARLPLVQPAKGEAPDDNQRFCARSIDQVSLSPSNRQCNVFKCKRPSRLTLAATLSPC